MSRPDEDPTIGRILLHLRHANEVARVARSRGNHPFGAILVNSSGEVILEHGNEGTLNHAETMLARSAAEKYSAEYLWHCTLYTTVEPCVMCAGTIYWSNIGNLVFGLAESGLLELTGNHAENPTLEIPCRYVFEHGQKSIKVLGTIPELQDEILELHRDFWKNR